MKRKHVDAFKKKNQPPIHTFHKYWEFFNAYNFTKPQKNESSPYNKIINILILKKKTINNLKTWKRGNYNLKDRISQNKKQNWKKVLNDSKNHTHIESFDELSTCMVMTTSTITLLTLSIHCKRCRLMLPKYRIYHKINNHKKMQSRCWLFQTKAKREKEDQKPQENITT